MRAKQHDYTDEQLEFVRDNIKGTTYKDMTKMFNERFGTELKLTQMSGFLKRNNLTNGRDAQFVKGQKAWNKGMKGLNLGGEKGWFKKGHTPQNHKPVGSERINIEGYVEIKTAEPSVWRLKQRVVWEKANGEIPKDHVIVFGDGDKTNFDLSNLVLVSRRQLAMLNKNGLIKNDVELTRIGVTIADLHLKVSERGRK